MEKGGLEVAHDEPKKVCKVTEVKWPTAIFLALFAILGSFGGAFSVKTMIEHHTPWVLLGYAAAGGIFIAASVVVILQLLSFSMNEK